MIITGFFIFSFPFRRILCGPVKTLIYRNDSVFPILSSHRKLLAAIILFFLYKIRFPTQITYEENEVNDKRDHVCLPYNDFKVEKQLY